MSQIFCVRGKIFSGLAVVSVDDEILTLLATYPSADDDPSNFSGDLKELIEKHGVDEIWLDPQREGDPSPAELSEFKGISENVSIHTMRYLPRTQSGLSTRTERLKAGTVDETSFYGQSDKLAERIGRLSEKAEAPLDIQAYLSAVVLAQPDADPDAVVLLGSCAPTHDDIDGGGGMVRTVDYLRML